MSEPENKIYKFDDPIPTKSGEYVGVLWRELQQQWQTFKTAELNQDQTKMVETARRIQDIQDDLGLTVADFGDLEVDIRILRNKSK